MASAKWRSRGKKTLKILLVIIIIGTAWYFIRPLLRPSVPKPTEAMLNRAKHVRILRDNLGVPHIFGKSDADTAFGLAYAHAEDDYPIIQGSLAAARGQLGLIMLKPTGVINDYLVRFLGLSEKVDEQYANLISPQTRKLIDAYAEGLNFYASLHPDEVDSRLLPFQGKDVIAGFIHKLSLFVGVGDVLQNLMSREAAELEVGVPIQRLLAGNAQLPGWYRAEMAGSNAHAVARSRSADGITRLNINSHQPWEGAVAWYEAHVVSEEGWNAIGGIFPGAPVILHGHNRHLGWAHTVNRPDGVDVYKLNMHADGSMRYLYDGEWMDLEVSESTIYLDIGLFNLPIPRDLYRSVHGPVMKLEDGFYAIRYVGRNRTGLAVEQWYRMNRSRNIGEWKAAMSLLGIPMMNTMYADSENILYVYYHLLPVRNEGFDWLGILPGDTSKTVWNRYLSFDELPMSENPPSGYLINTNSTPFKATMGAGNSDPAAFAANLAIETRMNNRAIRSHELFGGNKAISRETFLQYKFDQTYSRESPLYKKVIEPLLENCQPENENEKRALQILKNWDGKADVDSTGAALINILYRKIWKAGHSNRAGTENPDIIQEFKAAVEFLADHFDSVEVPLGKVQRLQRGETDLPLGGSIDVLNAVHTKIKDGRLVGTVGDSYILFVEFDGGSVQSWSRHQYGNVNRKDSKHYDDQAEDFVNMKLKRSLLTETDIRKHLESEYHPGDKEKSAD